LDGALTTWAIFVLANGVPYLIGIATLVLVILRIMLAWREWRRGA
jgi:hypothetical protein